MPPFIVDRTPSCEFCFIFTEPHEHPSQPGHTDAAPTAALHLRAAAHVPAGEPLPRLPARLRTLRVVGPPWEDGQCRPGLVPSSEDINTHRTHTTAPTDIQAMHIYLKVRGQVSSTPQTLVGNAWGLCWSRKRTGNRPHAGRREWGGGLTGAETRAEHSIEQPVEGGKAGPMVPVCPLQMAPSGGPPQQPPPVAQQPPAQGPPAQGSEAQLISFD